MSSLHKQLIRPKFPLPPLSGGPGGAAKRQFKRRDYTPVKWSKYFESYQDIQVTSQDVFRVYRKGNAGPLLLLLHGGGYSGLTWATLTETMCSLVECQIAAVDLRGHGETFTSDDEDLSAGTLARDVGNIASKLFEDSPPPPIIMIGHSMGGAVAVHAAFQELIPSLIALAVIDVVEGTAMDALQSMQTFLRSRPSSFRSLEAAIEWCVRSGQVRNSDSAKVSMPGQLKNYGTNKPATAELEDDGFQASSSADLFNVPAPLILQRGTSIPEEQEEEDQNDLEEKKDEEKDALEQLTSKEETVGNVNTNASLNTTAANTTFVHPSEVSSSVYSWRIDLSKTEKYWSGWFQGLSAMFLSCNVPKLLLLAGVDRLDRELTIGQMQGKFQMQVLPQCGHAVHEDLPDKVADVLAAFMVRHKFVQPTDNYLPMFPGC